MARLREYYDLDFSYTLRLRVQLTVDGEPIESHILYDFSGYSCFVACYVPGENRPLDFFLRLLQQLAGGGEVRVEMNERAIKLPSAREFPGTLRVANTESLVILAQFWSDTRWVSSSELCVTKRFFIYAESPLSDADVLQLQAEGQKHGRDVQFRSEAYVMGRTRFEVPVAFICHDSRDKDDVAKEIAAVLQGMLIPVWYDEFSLKVGVSLRESIEKGLKECKKCILILSPNFLSNNGWTKKEFDSIFIRETREQQRIVLPVWYNVTPQQVYDYCPSLTNTFALDWNKLGKDEVCRQLHQALWPP